MFKLDYFPEAAPRYPDRIAVRAKPGTRAQLMRAARAAQLTVPDFVRQAIERQVSAVRVSHAEFVDHLHQDRFQQLRLVLEG